MLRRLAPPLAIAAVLALSAATALAAPGDIERATVAENPLDEPSDGGRYPQLSRNGAVVLFNTDANNIFPGDSSLDLDVYVRRVALDTTGRVSLANDESEPNAAIVGGFHGSLNAASADYAGFESTATNLLVGADTNGASDIFIREPLGVGGGSTTRVSLGDAGVEANAGSFDPSLSADAAPNIPQGRVAFESDANNLDTVGPVDTGVDRDIYLRDLQVGTTRRLSLSTTDTEVNATHRNPMVAPDETGVNRQVTFESDGALDPLDTNGVSDVYLRGNTTQLISLNDDENQGSEPSLSPQISEDGQEVAFVSENQLAGGGAPGPDSLGAYVRDRVAGQTARADVTFDGSSSAGVASQPLILGSDDQPIAISPDGNRVAFSSLEDSLVPNDTNSARDVFVRDLTLDRTVRVNMPVTGVEPSLASGEPSLSSNGSVVAFMSKDNGLVPGDDSSTASAYFDIFVAQVDFSVPQTTIGTPPPANTTSNQVAVGFNDNKTGSDFQCRLDSAPFTACTSPWVTPSAAVGAHAVQIRSIDRFGNVDDTPAAASFTVRQPPATSQTQPQPPPPPVFRTSFNLEPVSGTVFITVPGGRRVRLEDLTQIPSGSLVDTRKGRVRLFAAAARRGSKVVSSEFFDGLFRVVQLRSGIIELRLAGGSFRGCTARRSTVSASARRRKKVRRLWGKGKGKFRTRGKYGAASVRGTTWLVEDRCDGTLIAVRVGSVTASDFAKRKRVIVRKGKRYLARPRARR